MANHLDLEEQEQLDQLKDFWKQYGNLITWVLILSLGAFVAYAWWNKYQADQAIKAGVLFDELDRVASAGDVEKTTRVAKDLISNFPRTTYAEQGGLLAAKVQAERGKADDARASLEWVASQAAEVEYQAIARLRLAGLLMDQKKYDEAGKILAAEFPKEFAALAADRKGDLLQLQGKSADAVSAYQQAWKSIEQDVGYRKVIAAKLTALGAAPDVAASEAGVKP
ncbi:YfgM family protein [Aquabacterium sp.]|uniref:YfgM family protein n=1 Tax=Aquabacterium sp. TaxID=1872578 RepID=UPI0035B14CC0